MSSQPAPRPQSCSVCVVHRSFCPLADDALSALETLKTTIAFRKGETIFHESDACHSVFVICDGSVKLLDVSSEGKILLLRFARPGEILGIAEAVRGETPYECSAVAAEPSVIARIPASTFLRFAGTYPSVALRLTFALCEQYSNALRETRFLSLGETSTARLARLLLDWCAERGDVPADGVRISAHITHSDLAQSIGATRETVTRILGSLDQRGIIERSGHDIVIRSADELIRLAAF